MIDPSEKFVYVGKADKPWWRTGVPRPPGSPRDLLWGLHDQGGSTLVVTLDLRTLKLYARFDPLTRDTERWLASRRP